MKSKYTLVFGLLLFLMLIATGQLTKAQDDSTITFSGYAWLVKQGYGGPGPNDWDPELVNIDNKGLHLKVAEKNGQWYSSEVWLPNSLGYGTYEFEIASPVEMIDSSVVAAVFLYQDDEHEIDVEFSIWNGEVSENAQFVVQPFLVKGNRHRFNAPEGRIIQRIIWEPTAILFETISESTVVEQWKYAGKNNFAPGAERVHINLWQYQGLAPESGKEQEFIVERFTFTPRELGETTVEEREIQNSGIEKKEERKESALTKFFSEIRNLWQKILRW